MPHISRLLRRQPISDGEAIGWGCTSGQVPLAGGTSWPSPPPPLSPSSSPLRRADALCSTKRPACSRRCAASSPPPPSPPPLLLCSSSSGAPRVLAGAYSSGCHIVQAGVQPVWLSLLPSLFVRSTSGPRVQAWLNSTSGPRVLAWRPRTLAVAGPLQRWSLAAVPDKSISCVG